MTEQAKSPAVTAADKVAEKVSYEPINLEALIKLGTLEKEIETIPGMFITMHALLQKEREEVSKLMPVSQDEAVRNSFYTASESEKVPTLIYAITRINDTVYKTPAEKDILKDQLSKIPSVSLDLIYLAYSRLCVEQLGVLSDGIKKKS